MSDQEICDYFDTNPNVTLSDLRRMTGLSIEQLKAILMRGR